MKILKTRTYNKMVQEKTELETSVKKLKQEVNDLIREKKEVIAEKEAIIKEKLELCRVKQEKIETLEKAVDSWKEKNDTALLVIKDLSEKNDLLMVDKEELNKILGKERSKTESLNQKIIDLTAENALLKSKLSRPKAKKCTTETCTDCEKTAETPDTEQVSEEATPIQEEKPAISQEEYIKEFFSFLKNENPKLPKKFKKAFDPNFAKIGKTCDEFLVNCHPNDFVVRALNWSTDKSVQWLDLSVSWMNHLKTFKK